MTRSNERDVCDCERRPRANGGDGGNGITNRAAEQQRKNGRTDAFHEQIRNVVVPFAPSEIRQLTRRMRPAARYAGQVAQALPFPFFSVTSFLRFDPVPPVSSVAVPSVPSAA